MYKNEAPHYKEALERLYIDYNFDALLNDGTSKAYNYPFLMAGPPLGLGFDEVSQRYVYGISDGYLLWNELHLTQGEQRKRAFGWCEARQTKLKRVHSRLYDKLTGNNPAINHNARGYATGSYNAPTYHEREALRELVHGVIKSCGDPRRIHTTNSDPASVASSHNAAFAFYTAVLGGFWKMGNEVRSWYPQWRDTQAVMARLNPLLQIVITALELHEYKISCGQWMPIAWANESWWRASLYSKLHFLHVSEKNPELVAYTQSGDKLVKDIQTAVKPGRYLSQFFSDVLTEEEIRMWAHRQVEENKPSELRFVPNTDPDGWEWVYENPSGYSSCMWYNHSARYLHRELCGENHPVRTYCHPDNDLALAYIGSPVGTDGGVALGRAIVNTERKTYVRLYGDARLTEALRAARYSHDAYRTLNGQKLLMREYASGYIMPYLDGDVTNVRTEDDYFVVDEDGEYDAQQSSGLMEDSDCRTTCVECGDACYEDDMTYVEVADGMVCDSCLDNRFVYAYLRRGQEWCYERDCVRCETDGEWYHGEYASYHNIYECVATGDYYSSDDLVPCKYGLYSNEYVHCDLVTELPDGEYCHRDDYDAVMAEYFPEEEEAEAAPMAQPLTVAATPEHTGVQP